MTIKQKHYMLDLTEIMKLVSKNLEIIIGLLNQPNMSLEKLLKLDIMKLLNVYIQKINQIRKIRIS
jgi:hypothetical protein